MNTEFIENISTDTKYFFTNKEANLYRILLVKNDSTQESERFTLTVIPDVPFQISPLEFELLETLTLADAANKEELYKEVEKVTM